MSDAAVRLRKAVVDRVLQGPGVASSAGRRAAFDNSQVDGRARALVDTIARQAWEVTDRDVAAVKAAGLSEDEIFELAVSAALGQATRQIETALEVLTSAAADAPVHDPSSI
jgi:hypothetical protein